MNWRTLIVAGYMNRYGNGFTKMDLRDSTSMRNYELLKKIWAIINMRSPSPSAKVTAVENLIKKHRPELKKQNEATNTL